MKKQEITGGKILSVTWKIISIGISVMLLLIFLFLFAGIIGMFLPASIQPGNVAIIPINGLISTGEDSFMKGVDSQEIVEKIEEADENSNIKAIILEINSPGGTPVATDEIASAVKAVNKTVVAVIRESGASGAYWIATAADKIFANKMSLTGSIGVQASRLEFTGLLADYNVTYRKLTAGRLKDAGSRFRDMTLEEQTLFQSMLDKLHNEFIRTVAENRNLPEQKVRELATGFVYLGSEAKELGLIDELGGRKEAVKYIEQTLDIKAETVEYKEPKGLFEELTGLTSGFSADALISKPAVSFT